MFKRKQRLVSARRRQLAEIFATGTPVRKAASQAQTQANTAARYFRDFRERIAHNLPCLVASPRTLQHFAGVSITAGAVQMFFGLRLPEKGSGVQIVVSPKIANAAGIPYRRRKIVVPDSIACTEAFRLNFDNAKYTTVPTFALLTIKHSTRVARDSVQVAKLNEIWRQIRAILNHYRGMTPAQTHRYLKEVEWRLNGANTAQLHHTPATCPPPPT